MTAAKSDLKPCGSQLMWSLFQCLHHQATDMPTCLAVVPGGNFVTETGTVRVRCLCPRTRNSDLSRNGSQNFSFIHGPLLLSHFGNMRGLTDKILLAKDHHSAWNPGFSLPIRKLAS